MIRFLLLKGGRGWQGLRFSSICFQNSKKFRLLNMRVKKIFFCFIVLLNHVYMLLVQPRLLIKNVSRRFSGQLLVLNYTEAYLQS